MCKQIESEKGKWRRNSASWEPPSCLGLKSREVSVSEIQSGSWFQREGPGSWFLGPSTITSVLSITKTKTQMFLWSFWIKYSASENTDEKSSSVVQIGTGKTELAAAGCSYIHHTTESQPWRFLLSICVCFKSRAVLTVGLNKPHTHTHSWKTSAWTAVPPHHTWYDWKDVWLGKVCRRGLDFLEPENRAWRRFIILITINFGFFVLSKIILNVQKQIC